MYHTRSQATPTLPELHPTFLIPVEFHPARYMHQEVFLQPLRPACLLQYLPFSTNRLLLSPTPMGALRLIAFLDMVATERRLFNHMGLPSLR